MCRGRSDYSLRSLAMSPKRLALAPEGRGGSEPPEGGPAAGGAGAEALAGAGAGGAAGLGAGGGGWEGVGSAICDGEVVGD
jgi:hypothetical protein